MHTLILLTALIACVEPSFVPESKLGGTQDVAATYECAATESPLASDDPSVAGISADDLAAFIGTREATFGYYAGGETTVTLTSALAADPILRDWEPTATSTGDCANDSVVMELALGFDTADGAFTESWVETVNLSTWDGHFYLGTYLPIADHLGSFSLAGTDQLSIPMNLSADSWSGEVVAVDDDGGISGECGIGGWNGSLATGC